MSETVDLLEKIQQRIKEKDLVIEEQMSQLADLEDEVARLRVDLEELKNLKTEYLELKSKLDSLIKE